MPPATTAEATVYQLTPGKILTDHLVPSNTTTATLTEIDVGGTRSLLVTGTRDAARPPWARHVTAATGHDVDVSPSTPYAVLLVPLGTWNYAVCWGGGWHLIDHSWTNVTFAIDFARRRFDSTTVRAIDSVRVGARAPRTTTAMLPGGLITDFALDPLTNAIEGISGTANLTGLTCDQTSSRPRRMSAGRSLKLPIGLSGPALIADLRAIEHAIAHETPAPFWRIVEGITRLRGDEPVITQLESKLARAFDRDVDGGPVAHLGYTWPAGIAVTPNATYLLDLGASRNPQPTPDFDIDGLIAEVGRVPVDERLGRLETLRIYTCDPDTGERIDNARARAWLIFETEVEDVRHVLAGGQWYAFDSATTQRLVNQIGTLIGENTIELDLPTWLRPSPADGRDENRYCMAVASAGGDFVVLDRKLIKTDLNPRLEVCDLLGPGDELIHVKWLGNGASSASHLFAQVEAAAVALHHERALVRRELDLKLAAATDGRRRVGSLECPTFVLAIGGRRWNADDLFAMSRIQLLGLAGMIARLDGTLKFATIPSELVTDALTGADIAEAA